MSIIIVAGPTCSGKSTFIKNNFPKHTKIDVFDFQQKLDCFSVDNIMKSYIECRDALVSAIKNNKNVVLEHTLLKKCRRDMYVNAIKETTGEPIEMYFLFPSDEQLLSQMQMRKYSNSKTEVSKMKELAELPTVGEGYKVVHIISDDPKFNTVEYAQ